ncbi:MAG: glycosyltransferase family 2 protein [Planctomycetaceae bacterium]
MSDHPHALCQLLGRRVCLRGHLLDLWHTRGDYRQLWCRQAGIPLADAEQLCPPLGPQHQATNLDCLHRGHKLRDEPCKPCKHAGQITVPVHACAVHGECVLRGSVHGRDEFGSTVRLATCASCHDRAAPNESDAAPPESSRRHPLRKHVTRFAVGITSAPRRIPTVAESARSIRAAGFEPIIFAEPGTNGLPSGFEIVHRPQKLGCFHNYLQTLRDLLQRSPSAQAIVIFQDDAEAAPELREFLEHDLWPSSNTGAVSLYSPDFRGYESTSQLGFKRITGKYLMGAVAMVYPRSVAEALVTRHTAWRGVAKGEPLQDETKKKAVDTWIGHAVAGEKRHVYYPNPSLVQHIAETSSLGHGGNQQIKKGRLYRRSAKFSCRSPFEIWADNMPAVRFNGDGELRLAEPLSIVVPAWNCFDLTERCLTALAANAGVDPLDVIYVDNGSDVGVVEAVEQLADRLTLPLRVIRFPENRGFCPAANAGMEAAAGRHVLLLNNDCYIHRGCLPAMLRHLLSSPRVASVGPLTADQGSQSVTRHESLRKLRGKRQTISRRMLVGFCQLKRREALAEVGLLDSNLPHGLGTDDDWAARAIAKGWKLLLACDAFADHDHKSTFRRSGQDRRAMQVEAMAYLKAKGVLK